MDMLEKILQQNELAKFKNISKNEFNYCETLSNSNDYIIDFTEKYITLYDNQGGYISEPMDKTFKDLYRLLNRQ
jgi:uncharacterized phage-like protein YoqJ